MLIHEVVKQTDYVHAVDPVRGPIIKEETSWQPGSTHAIVHEGVEYKRQDDGSFDLPPEHAGFFLRQPTWVAGPAVSPPKPAPEPKSKLPLTPKSED